MISSDVIISMAVGTVLCILIPITAVVVFKLKFKKSSLLSAVIGAGTFLLFALVLEQLLHAVMLPLVIGSDVLYVLYGTLAAGVFEESGRFLVCKFLMKKRSDNANAVMLGLGHGGFEAIALTGTMMLSFLVMAFLVNSVGFDEFAKNAGAISPELTETLRAQVEAIGNYTLPVVLLNVLERIIAMTLHVSMSVVVMKAAIVKGKLWLYPVAILMHAAFDVPAALYQRKLIGEIWLVELLLAMFAVAAVFVAVKASKLRNKEETVA